MWRCRYEPQRSVWNFKLDRGSIESSPKYGIGPPPKKNIELKNDPTMVNRLAFGNLLLDQVELLHVLDLSVHLVTWLDV